MVPMKKKIRKVISLAASLATVASVNVAILSESASKLRASETDPNMCKSILFDHSVLKSGSDTKEADIVYFGHLTDDERSAVPYRVIGYDKGGCVSMDASRNAVVLYSNVSIIREARSMIRK